MYAITHAACSTADHVQSIPVRLEDRTKSGYNQISSGHGTHGNGVKWHRI